MAETVSAPSLFNSIENIIKIITLGGIVATAFGLGAMYVQFERYGIPMSLLSFEQAARAGLLPTAIAILLGLYVYLAFKFPPFVALSVLMTGFLPAALPAMIFIVVLVLGYFAGLVWIIDQFLSLYNYIGYSLSNKMLLSQGPVRFVVANAVMMFIVGLVCFFHWREQRARRRIGAAERTDTADAGSPPTDRAAHTKADMGLTRLLIYCVLAAVIVGPSFAASLFAVRWYISAFGIADVLVGLLTARAILILSVQLLIFLAILLASWALSLYLATHPRFARWTAVGSAGAIFIIAWVLYCELFYPVLSPALGGGKLEAITIWITAEDFSEDARKRLPANSCTETAKLIRCDHVNSVPVGESYFVITAEHPPALVLKGRSVKAFAMSTEP